MSRIQTRKKQRREYLRKKGTAYTVAFLAALGALLGALIFLVRWDPVYRHLGIGSRHIAVVGTLALILIVQLLFQVARRVHRRAVQIPYVPPVTADTLPAEEVLVRGTVEPTGQQSEVLLRGAQGGGVTPAEELLRSSDASVKEQHQVILRGTQNTEEADGQELLRSSQRNDWVG